MNAHMWQNDWQNLLLSNLPFFTFEENHTQFDGTIYLIIFSRLKKGLKGRYTNLVLVEARTAWGAQIFVVECELLNIEAAVWERDGLDIVHKNLVLSKSWKIHATKAVDSSNEIVAPIKTDTCFQKSKLSKRLCCTIIKN